MRRPISQPLESEFDNAAMNDFAACLNEIKGDRKVVELSQITGLPAPYLSRYLHAKNNQPPTMQTIWRMATAAEDPIIASLRLGGITGYSLDTINGSMSDEIYTALVAREKRRFEQTIEGQLEYEHISKLQDCTDLMHTDYCFWGARNNTTISLYCIILLPSVVFFRNKDGEDYKLIDELFGYFLASREVLHASEGHPIEVWIVVEKESYFYDLRDTYHCDCENITCRVLLKKKNMNVVIEECVL